jgi:hypothetical protein
MDEKELAMNLKEKISVIMLALIFMVASAYVFGAGAGEKTVRQLAAGSYENVKIVPVASWSEPGTPLGPTVTGGRRVNRDLGAYTKDDTNQFGDDRAYNSSQRGNDRDADRQADYKASHWTPETYGLMGDYWRDADKGS